MPVLKKLANDEQFIQIAESPKYYISNYGRLIFKEGKPILLDPQITDAGHKVYDLEDGGGILFADRLVSRYFIDKPDEQKGRLIHIDGDLSNNYFKNLRYIQTEPVYIKYADKRRRACVTWRNMISRVEGEYPTAYGYAYNSVRICQEWLESRGTFIEWFFDNYYECGYEQMQFDKDLLSGKEVIYSPETCCFLPRSLNTLVASSHPRLSGRDEFMPLGVNKIVVNGRNKYHSTVTYRGNRITTELRDTPMKAFYDFEAKKRKIFLQVAEENKNILPAKVYNALRHYKIKPWNRDMCCT